MMLASVLRQGKSLGGPVQWRMCVDYRKLNKSKVPGRYPMPTYDEQLSVVTANWPESPRAADLSRVSTFTLASGKCPSRSWSVTRRHSSRTTAFFWCTAMLFGLVNAPAVFQRMMDTALADCIARGFCRVYIDEIVVYSKTNEEHVAHLDDVLLAIDANRLMCKPPKCFVGYRQIVHLGHLVGSGGIRVDHSTARAIDEYPELLKKIKIN